MTEKGKAKASLKKLPCQYCMDYWISDAKFHPDEDFKNKMEILRYLNKIKDPKVNKIITDLIKSIACS